MTTGQISRRRRLVAADLAGENAEVLRESEGEEASAAAEEEVFGLEKCFGRVKEKKPPPPRKRKGLVWSLTLIYPNKFIGRFSLSCSTSQTLSLAAKTLTIEGGSMATGQISQRRRLVAADLAGENAEVLQESEGEEAFAAAEVKVFGLEFNPNKFIGCFSLSLAQPLKHSHRRQKHSPSKEDPWPPDRSIGIVVSLQKILPEKTQKCFGRVKENKPPPPRKRKCLVWSLTLIYPNKFIGHFSLSLAQPLKHSHPWQKLSPSKEDPWPPDRSLGIVVSLQQIMPEKTQKCFGRVKEKKPLPPRKRKCLVWMYVREITCSTLFRIFHRFLSSAASVDVVDE
ncbi:uncharacterized protein G2W53_014842 [Senna tora]|uniref:Uncharacterized protein n=1 Tax=Senna tora TaxID=362788 RepID=A0A834WU49_9FABA|nr:uncharacterized protein G2W53_014842 [Senna tora]